MTTYPKTLLTDAIYSDKALRPFQISYFRERYRNRLHAEVLKLFKKVGGEQGLSKADLARRLNKRPEQITRWLSAPGNWTLDTVSELMLAMGHEPTVGSQQLAETSRGNYFHPISVNRTPAISITLSHGPESPKATAPAGNTAVWESAA